MTESLGTRIVLLGSTSALAFTLAVVPVEFGVPSNPVAITTAGAQTDDAAGTPPSPPPEGPPPAPWALS